MAPFITEELFQLLKERFPSARATKLSDPYTQEALKALETEACIKAPYPKTIREADINPDINNTFELVDKVVYTIRNSAEK